MTRWRFLAALGLLALGRTAQSPDADAAQGRAVAARPLTIAVGEPRGDAIAASGGPRRARGSADWLAPTDPAVHWHGRVSGGITCDPLVDQRERVFVAGQGRVTQLNADGTPAFSRRFDFDRARAAALATDGRRLVLDDARRVWAVEEDGRLRFAVSLGVPPARGAPALLPMLDASVVASVGRWHVHVAQDGSVLASTNTPQAVRETLRTTSAAILVGRGGGVYRWDGYGAAEQLGSLGGKPTAVAASHDGELIAVLTDGRLVTFDVVERALRRLARLERGGFLPFVSTGDEAVIAGRTDGSLVRLDNLSPPPRVPRGPLLSRSPLTLRVWSGARGSLAWISSTTPLSLELPGGAQLQVKEASCPEPQALTGLSRGRILLSCRSGQLWMVGPNEAPPVGAKTGPTDGKD